MNREEAIEYYEKEIAEIDKNMPWKEIARACIIREKLEFNGRLDTIMTEYYLLFWELEGLKEGKWNDEFDHPKTHVKALRRLLNMEEER